MGIVRSGPELADGKRGSKTGYSSVSISEISDFLTVTQGRLEQFSPFHFVIICLTLFLPKLASEGLTSFPFIHSV